MKPQRIRALMVAKQITNIEIARELGVTPVSVHGVIYGKWTSRRIAEAIARKLGMPLEKVFPRYDRDAA